MGGSHGNRCINSRQAMISALKFSSLLHKPKLMSPEAVLRQSRDRATENMASEIALIVAPRRCRKIISVRDRIGGASGGLWSCPASNNAEAKNTARTSLFS